MKVLQIFAQECSYDDLGLTLSFFLWQGQFCFLGFYMGTDLGFCRRFFWVQKLINTVK